MFPLGLLSPGELAEIVSIRDIPQTKSDCRVEDMGLRVGKQVEMLTNGGGGPLLLKVDESRLAIARGMAMNILVRRQ
ncbi:MAG: FeoA family protein [Trichloromonadaceae bacterium]